MSRPASDMEVTESSRPAAEGETGLPSLPALGFRNYWYPALESRRVGQRPIPIRVLGGDLVLFRSQGKVAALEDRPPHRRAKLSLGWTLFPRTISCGYHGWTFDGQGQCLPVLVEGLDSKIPGKVQVKAYPVEERFGVIWVFMGEGEPAPLEKDLPPDVLKPNVVPLLFFEEWKCDWCNVTENIIDASHPFCVHRNSLISFFQKIPGGAGKYWAEVLADGKGVHAKSGELQWQVDYPGLGKYPQDFWWRVLPRRGAVYGLEMRMPGYILVRRSDPYLGFRLTDRQWPYPIGEDHCRVLFFTIAYGKNFLRRAMKRAWWFYYRPIRRQFVHQDRRLLLPVKYRDPEWLSTGDAGPVHFRILAATAVRKASSNGGRSKGEVGLREVGS